MVHDNTVVGYRSSLFSARALREIADLLRRAVEISDSRHVIVVGSHEDSAKLALLLALAAGLTPFVLEQRHVSSVAELLGSVPIIYPALLRLTHDVRLTGHTLPRELDFSGLDCAVHRGPDHAITQEFAEDLQRAGYGFVTSGSVSSGRLVLGSLTAVSHFIEWESSLITHHLDGAPPTCSALTHVAFDPVLRDILLPLWCGGRIVIPPHQVGAGRVLTPDHIAALTKADASVWHVTPAVLRRVTSGRRLPESVKVIVTGGGELTAADVRNWYSQMRAVGPETALYVFYGLTEATLAQMWHRVSTADADSAHLPLGTPLPGIRIRNRPEASAQELVLEGDHMALGVYQLPPSATAYARLNGVVHTGDLVRHEHGNWYFAGRQDASFKVDGVTVIPHQVESAIRGRWPDADVVVLKDTFTEGAAIFMTLPRCPHGNVDELSSDVRSMLVDQFALLPRCSVQIVERIPLTERGKPDTAELSRRLDRRRMAPNSIYDLFPGGVLAGQDTASMTLRELGADSLLLAELAAFLEDRHGVAVDLDDLTSLTPESLAHLLSRPSRHRSVADDESSSSKVSLTQLRFLLHPVALAEPAALNFGWWFAHPAYTDEHLYDAVAAVLQEDNPFSVVFERSATGWHWHSRSMAVPPLQHLNLGAASGEMRNEKVYEFVSTPFDLQSDEPKCRIGSIGDGRSLMLAGTVLQSDGVTRRNLFRRVQKYIESGSRQLDSVDCGWADVFRQHVSVERQRFSEYLEHVAQLSGVSYRGDVRGVVSSFAAHVGASRDHVTGRLIGAVAQSLRWLGVEHDGIAVPYANRTTTPEWSSLGCFTDTIIVHPRLDLAAELIPADIDRQIAEKIRAFTPLLVDELRSDGNGPRSGMVMIAGQPSISQWIVNALPPRYALNRLHLFWTLDGRTGEISADLVARCDEFAQSDVNNLASHIKDALLEFAPAS